MRRVDIVLLFAVLIMFASNISATIINVPADQPNIQAGINASFNGDTVRVASGTYVENINFSGKNIVVGSWFLDAGDTSYISSTIIDGNQSARVVTFVNGEDNTAVITGFTIQNGFSAQNGGGIYCSSSSPTITNNTITGNSADYYGGGGICCWVSSNATISSNTISGNSASHWGGGIYCYYSSPTIINNTINGNSAGYFGGGIGCNEYSSPVISNNTITGNSGGTYGGGIFCQESSPVITNTIFWADSAPTGPEIYLYGTSSPVITYCDVQGGWAGEGNISCDPMFCDPENGNFYLDAVSCCVGAGEGGVDIGAFGVGCGMRYEYLPGDVNMAYGNWPPVVMPDDLLYFVSGGPPCLLDGFWASVDINGDCNITGGDLTALLGYIVAGGGSLSYCPDYEPIWPTPDELPDDPPPDWPPCEAPPLEPPEDDVFFWFGNLDESPIIANINDRVYIDVYIQTPNSAYIADMHIPVGIENQYIDDFLTADHQYFYPLTDWDYIITHQFGSPPNPTGWSSQSILAFSFNVWLHFETPQMIMKIAVQTVNDPELAGNTVQCIGIGSHPYGWPFCVGDTLGIFDYPITEYISPVFFNYPYLPGDVNMALGIWPPTVIGGDVTYLVGYFIGSGQAPCNLNDFWASADINGDCLIIGGDVTALVAYFIAGGSITHCPDYEPVWPPVPDNPPSGWPNCDTPVINSRVIPTGLVK